MKIRTRLTILFTLLVMAIIGIVSAVIYTSVRAFNQDRFYTRLNDKAVTKAVLLFNVEHLNSALLKTIDQARNDVMVNEKISVFDSTNRRIYTNNDSIKLNTSPALFARIKAEKEIRYADGDYKIAAIYYRDSLRSAIVIAAGIDKYGENLLSRMQFILFITIIGSIVVTGLVGWIFVGQSLSPITAIVQKVRHISPLRKSERLPIITENDEIAALVKTFNDLFDRLDEAFQVEKSFVANVSHELNNPLTKLKSQIDVALFQNRDNEFYRNTLQSIQEDIGELGALISNLLEFSRVSSKQFSAKALVRIDEVIFDAREAIMRAFPQYVVSIQLTNPPEDENRFIIRGNKQLLITAIKNLVENACKYSDDKSAAITLSIVEDSISVIVSDNGPGIAAEDIPHIFNLFYRSVSIESVKGFGIGLALAHRILAAHNIHIQVDSEHGKGTKFKLYFN